VIVEDGGHVRGIDAVLRPGGVIAGSVRTSDGRPARATLFVEREGVDYASRTLALDIPGDADFRFDGLRAGRYKVWVQPERRYIASYVGGAEPRVFVIGEGNSVEDAHLVLRPGARIAGSIQLPAGDPANDVCVDALSPSGGWLAGTTTDSMGHYVVEGVPVGRAKIAFSACGPLPVSDAWLGGSSLRTATAVAVDRVATYRVPSVRLERGPVANFEVRSVSATAPAEAGVTRTVTVTLANVGDEMGATDVRASVRPDGGVTEALGSQVLELAPGEVRTLTFSWSGVDAWASEADLLAMSCTWWDPYPRNDAARGRAGIAGSAPSGAGRPIEASCEDRQGSSVSAAPRFE
jgi:hypothetical protein